jgi:hypothetical protein
MRTFLAFLLLVGLGWTAPASAACFGSDEFSTCTDDSGNTYDIQRFGNQTDMNGSNAGTGSNWSEHSMTLGDTTYIDGQAANGNSWNETEQHIGNTEIYSGTDSNGNSFYRTCGPGGCSPSLGNYQDNQNFGNDESGADPGDDQDNESLGNNDDESLGDSSDGSE